MRKSIVKLLFGLLLLIVPAVGVAAQGWTFTDPNVDYSVEFPDAAWRIATKPSRDYPLAEFVYENRLDGNLEIRKEKLKTDGSLADHLEAIQEQKLQFLPGFVEGKQEHFAGALSGVVYNYEYTYTGKNAAGRLYLLKADDSTVYILHFTALRDKLRLIRNQTDSIARTFTPAK